MPVRDEGKGREVNTLIFVEMHRPFTMRSSDLEFECGIVIGWTALQENRGIAEETRRGTTRQENGYMHLHFT
jgi:hypothetical protein